MAIGLSTYAYTWRASDRMPDALACDLRVMLDDTAALGGTVFQICDYAPIETYPTAALVELRQQAADLGITLELGTRGLATEKLERYLEIAETLGAPLLRSMFNDVSSQPTLGEAEQQLDRIAPRLADAGVTLALETYEQVATDTLVSVVETVDNPRIGICLDPANCVAALEMPADVIARTADRVVNLHIKDFVFTRAEGWVGFRLLGAPLGDGLLDLDALLAQVRPGERGINLIVEHWLDWQGDAARTATCEAEWTRQSMTLLRSLET